MGGELEAGNTQEGRTQGSSVVINSIVSKPPCHQKGSSVFLGNAKQNGGTRGIITSVQPLPRGNSMSNSSTHEFIMDVKEHRKAVTLSRALKNKLHQERPQHLNLFRQRQKRGKFNKCVLKRSSNRHTQSGRQNYNEVLPHCLFLVGIEDGK